MRASAPAKAILFGEHAVVHGVPAIAVPIAARKTEVEVVETDADREIAIEDARGVETALAADMVRLALDQTKTPAKGARVKVASTIPLGSGLGSSAALAVTVDGNRRMLSVLGVSTPEVEAACDAAVAAGALGAKLSGAGGGGAVLAFLGPKSDPDRILGALKESGATETFVTEVTAS